MNFCEHCGAQIPDGALVCPACGRGTQSQPPQPQAQPQWAQQPQPPQSPKAPKGNWGGRILFLLLGLVFAGAITAALLAAGVLQFRSGAAPAAAAKVEGPGYASAEEAALAYAEALKAGDMDAMLATFAVESYATHLDRAAFILSMGVVYPTFGALNAPMPPADQGLALALNLEGRRIQIVQSFYYQYMNCLLHNTAYEDSFIRVTPLAEPEDVSALMELLQRNPGFSDMTIGATRSPEDLLDAERLESYLEHDQTIMDRQIEQYGAQDMQDVCLELTIDGEDYYLFVLAVRYDGKWYNLSFFGQLGAYLGIEYMSGGLVPVDRIQ